MQKLTTVLLALTLLPAFVVAQSKSLAEFHNKYRNMENTTYVDINGSLFNFVSGISKYANQSENEDDKKDLEAAGRILGAIEAMQVLEIPYKIIDKNDIASLTKKMKNEKFESLMTVKDHDSNINIMAQGRGSELRNITFLIDNDDNFVLLTFQGTLSMDDVSYLAKKQHNWY